MTVETVRCRLLLPLAVLLALAASPAASAATRPCPTPTATGCGGTRTAGPTTVACPGGTVTFTRYLLDPALIRNVTQIGSIGGGGALIGRSYVFPKADLDGRRLSLRAPAAMTLAGLGYYLPSGAPPGYEPEYSLLFDLGCGLALELYHVKALAPALARSAPAAASSSSAYGPVKGGARLKAGAVFAYYVREEGRSVAFDVILHDSRVSNRFPNQARYAKSNLLHVLCPWTRYAGAMQKTMLALVGTAGGVLTPDAGCGTVARAVDGTIAGEWWLTPGAVIPPYRFDGDYGEPMAVIEEADGTVRIGHLGGSTQDTLVSRGNPTWLSPAKVTGTHCYESDAGGASIAFQVVSKTSVKVAFRRTPCGAGFPEGDFRLYVR